MGAPAPLTRPLSVALMVIGILLVVRTVAAGGGAVAQGVLLGILFFAAGAARLWLSLRRP